MKPILWTCRGSTNTAQATDPSIPKSFLGDTSSAQSRLCDLTLSLSVLRQLWLLLSFCKAVHLPEWCVSQLLLWINYYNPLYCKTLYSRSHFGNEFSGNKYSFIWLGKALRNLALTTCSSWNRELQKAVSSRVGKKVAHSYKCIYMEFCFSQSKRLSLHLCRSLCQITLLWHGTSQHLGRKEGQLHPLRSSVSPEWVKAAQKWHRAAVPQQRPGATNPGSGMWLAAGFSP